MESNNQWNGFFYFDKNDKLYNCHFSEFPVVPGSLIISSFIKACRNLVKQSGPVKIKSFTFYKFVPPEKYSYSIRKNDEDYLCLLYNKGQLCSKGRISL